MGGPVSEGVNALHKLHDKGVMAIYSRVGASTSLAARMTPTLASAVLKSRKLCQLLRGIPS